MKESGNNKPNTHTDWESASSWFGERQNDRINTSGGRYSHENQQRVLRENTPGSKKERNEVSRINSDINSVSRVNTGGGNVPSAKRNASKKTSAKGKSSRHRVNRNSGKSNDELRREHAEKTRKKRKRRIIEWFVFTALIFVAVFIVASLTVLFHIEEINVEGETRYSAEEIIECSGIEKGDNLWLTLTSDVYERLSYSLPYIGSVKIKRSIPSGITVIAEEAVPEYAVKNGKSFIIVDKNDKVLELKSKKSGKIPIISGVDASASEAGRKLKSDAYENYSTAKEIIKQANENSIAITSVNVKDANNISAVCIGKIRLDFGSASQLSEKLKMANEVISKLKSEGSLSEGVINLKSTTKAFYRDGSIDETEPTSEKIKETRPSDSEETQTDINNTSQPTEKVSENTTESESTTKSDSSIPAPPAQRPE